MSNRRPEHVINEMRGIVRQIGDSAIMATLNAKINELDRMLKQPR